MRLLARSDLGACRVLVADSSSNRVPAAASEQVPTGGAAVYHMPRFSEVGCWGPDGASKESCSVADDQVVCGIGGAALWLGTKEESAQPPLSNCCTCQLHHHLFLNTTG